MPVDTIKIVNDNPNRIPVIICIFAVAYLIYALTYTRMNSLRKFKLIQLKSKLDERHTRVMFAKAQQKRKEEEEAENEEDYLDEE